jgi:hypothetical protein
MSTNFKKVALLAVVLTLLFAISWELMLRSGGYDVSYDDGPELWSHKRTQVYHPQDRSTVFIGSSRIKYDLDIETWKKLTGNIPVMLAIEGNSPLPVLEHLADDANFSGRVVVDVTEQLFFTNSPFNLEYPREHVAYFNDRTPAQKVSFAINMFLESGLVLLDRDNFALNKFLDKLHLKNRPGVFEIPNIWPPEFGRITAERQNIMMPRFLTDSSLIKRVTGNWEFFRKINDEKPAEGKKMDSLLSVVKTSVDKIRSRGGDVLFVRTPSSGPFWEMDQKDFPREKYWDRLLSFTNCKGVHFNDYPNMRFICPEWSHLSHPDAISFTKQFINILATEKGWTFLKPNNSISFISH